MQGIQRLFVVLVPTVLLLASLGGTPAAAVNNGPPVLCVLLPGPAFPADLAFASGGVFAGWLFVAVTNGAIVGITPGCGPFILMPFSGMPATMWGIDYEPNCDRLFFTGSAPGGGAGPLDTIYEVYLSPGGWTACGSPGAGPFTANPLFTKPAADYRSLSVAIDPSTGDGLVTAADFCNGEVDRGLVWPFFGGFSTIILYDGVFGVDVVPFKPDWVVLTSNPGVPGGCASPPGSGTVAWAQGPFGVPLNCNPPAPSFAPCEDVADPSTGVLPTPEGVVTHGECAFFAAGGDVQDADWPPGNPGSAGLHLATAASHGVTMSPFTGILFVTESFFLNQGVWHSAGPDGKVAPC